MKLILLAVSLSLFIYTQAQYTAPRIEASFAPGLFFEQLSNDALVPPDHANSSRLGDVVSFAMQYAAPLKNERFTLKAGLGFSQRHYSINKYSFGEFISSIFLFDSPYHGDTFNLSYVRFTNNYFQVPLSGSYTLTRPRHNFQLAIGLNLRSDFLIGRKAEVVFDSAYKIPQPGDIQSAKQVYTRNASTFVFTAEPYIEASFSVHKNLGLLFQFMPLSYYSTPLDKRLTVTTVEFFSFKFGAFYSFK